MDIGKWSDTLDRWLKGSLSPDDLHRWQCATLREVVAHAQWHSRFYAYRLVWVRPSTLTLDNLALLPFTTDDDVRDAMFDVLRGSIGDAHLFRKPGKHRPP